MIIVTGGAGFIGSNLVKALNERGHSDILVVDDLTDGAKIKNLFDCDIIDYLNKDTFLERVQQKNTIPLEFVEAIFHLGACSSTTEWNGKIMMEDNYSYSKTLCHYCIDRHIPFIYASSASVYGNGDTFIELPEYESPINMYAYSKYLFDQYVRRLLPDTKTQIVGLRYFNVYGPREAHKGNMASMAYKLQQQCLTDKKLTLFSGSHGFNDGEQTRDFIYVDDAVSVNLWFLDNSDKQGIFNVGTGTSNTFNSIAQSIIQFYKQGDIEYTSFPESLKDQYQPHTQADITKLREAGYDAEFLSIEQGISRYMETGLYS